MSDENLWQLRDSCAAIHRRYENHPLFGRHLDQFITEFGFSPRGMADSIQRAYEENRVPPFAGPSADNTARMALIDPLISSVPARMKLLEMQRGYIVRAEDDPDEVLYAGFSKETAKTFIENFEKFLMANRDRLEALRILWNSEDRVITHSMLVELRDSLLAENRQYDVWPVWRSYRLLDEDGRVEELDAKANANALTHLIQIVRFAFRRIQRLSSLFGSLGRNFSLYCGQAQRTLTEDQQALMRRIAEYVIHDGALDPMELNEVDPDLWRMGVTLFGAQLAAEMQTLARFLLRAA